MRVAGSEEDRRCGVDRGLVPSEDRLLVVENGSDERHLVRLKAGAVNHLEHLRGKAKGEAPRIVAISSPLIEIIAVSGKACCEEIETAVEIPRDQQIAHHLQEYAYSPISPLRNRGKHFMSDLHAVR